MNQRQRFSHIIIGGTFFQLGQSLHDVKNTLILEASPQLGSDWVYCFHPGCNWENTDSLHPEAADFVDLLKKSYLRYNRLHPGGLAAAISKWALCRGLIVNLSSTVISQSGNMLTVATPGGFYKVWGDKIISAQSKRSGEGNAIITIKPDSPRQCYLTALANHPLQGVSKLAELIRSTESIKPWPMQILPTSKLDQTCLAMSVDDECDWPTARNRFHQAWLSRPPQLEAWQLTLIASRFLHTQFDNPALALNAGILQGL